MSRIACVVLGLTALAGSAHAATAKSPQELRTELAAYSQAIVRNSRDIAAYISRGSVRAKLGDNAGAIDDDSAALALDPDNVVALTNRGNARAARRDFRGALADYNRAIALDPHHKSAYLNRGNVETEQQDYQAAIADDDRVLALDPKDTMAFYDRAAAERATGNYEVAIDDYSKVIAAQPNDVRALINRAVIRMARRDWPGAQTDLESCLALLAPPKQIYPRVYLWIVEVKQGHRDQADREIKAYHQQLKENPWTPSSRLVTFLAGDMQDWQLTAHQLSPSPAPDAAINEAKANFVAGIWRCLSGDKMGGRVRLEKTIALGDPKMHEVILAREELKK